MNDLFLDSTEDLLEILKTNKFDSSIQKAAMKTEFMHPSLIQKRLFELSLTKKEIVIKSQSATGKSFGGLAVILNKLVKAIKKSESTEPNYSVVLCPNKAVANKNLKTLETLSMFAKNEYGIHTINLTQFHFDVLKNEEYFDQKKKIVLVGTPTLFKKFLLAVPSYADFLSHTRAIFVDELNYMLAFGYKADLEDVFQHLRKNVDEDNLPTLIATISQEGDERLAEFRKNILHKPATIKFDEEDLEELKDNNDGEDGKKKVSIANEYFYVSDNLTRYIALYFVMKLKFIAGKTLILCQDVDQAYKVFSFLERSEIRVAKVYNPEWPLNIRNYLLSVFNSGLVSILVAPVSILQDTEKAKGKYKDNHKLKLITNIVLFDFAEAVEQYAEYSKLLTFFGAVPCIVSLVEDNDKQKDKLFDLVEQQRESLGKAVITNLPIKQEEIEGFRYRVHDVVRSITRKQVSKMKQIDLKKQLLKSKNLKGYFDDHKQERDLIIKDVEKDTQRLRQYSTRLQGGVPTYLLPEEMRKKIEEKEAADPSKTTKILKSKPNEEFGKSLEKRLLNNGLTMDDVKKKIKSANDEYIRVNEDNEDPTLTDETRLTILSSRKLWKIKHKMGIKRRNRRLEKKGIFDPTTL